MKIRDEGGGAAFAPVGGTGLGNVEATRLLIDPENSARMLLASLKIGGNNNGVFRSVDGGVTWDRVLVNEGGYDIAIDPANSSRIYALSRRHSECQRQWRRQLRAAAFVHELRPAARAQPPQLRCIVRCRS